MPQAPTAGAPGLLFGILSIVCAGLAFMPIAGLLAALPGVAFGIVGLQQARRAGYTLGVACSIIGLVMCGTGLLIFIGAFLFLFGLFALFATSKG